MLTVVLSDCSGLLIQGTWKDGIVGELLVHHEKLVQVAQIVDDLEIMYVNGSKHERCSETGTDPVFNITGLNSRPSRKYPT
jgi:hypothetical protein